MSATIKVDSSQNTSDERLTVLSYWMSMCHLLVAACPVIKPPQDRKDLSGVLNFIPASNG